MCEFRSRVTVWRTKFYIALLCVFFFYIPIKINGNFFLLFSFLPSSFFNFGTFKSVKDHRRNCFRIRHSNRPLMNIGHFTIRKMFCHICFPRWLIIIFFHYIFFFFCCLDPISNLMRLSGTNNFLNRFLYFHQKISWKKTLRDFSFRMWAEEKKKEKKRKRGAECIDFRQLILISPQVSISF